MSFASVARKVLSVFAGVEHIAAVSIVAIDPALAPIVTGVDKLISDLQISIAKQEITNPVDGQGQLKSANVSADIEAVLGLTADAAGIAGYTISYDDGIKQEMINTQVQAYNMEQKVIELAKQFKASIKWIKKDTTIGPGTPANTKAI